MLPLSSVVSGMAPSAPQMAEATLPLAALGKQLSNTVLEEEVLSVISLKHTRPSSALVALHVVHNHLDQSASMSGGPVSGDRLSLLVTSILWLSLSAAGGIVLGSNRGHHRRSQAVRE